MKTRDRLLVGVAVLVVVVAVGRAWRQLQATKSQRDLLDAQLRQLAQAHERVADLEVELRRAASTAKSDQDQLERLNAAVAAKTRDAAETATSDSRSRPVSVLRTMENEAHFHAMLPIRYRSLWRDLKLTPEQIAAFESILEHEERRNHETLIAREEGKVDFATAEKAFAGARQDRTDALKALLGDDGFRRFQQANGPKNSQAGGFVATLAGDLYASDTPLAAAQGAQLKQLIVHHTEFVKKPVPASGGGQDTILFPHTDWSAVESAAATFLSPEQQAALQLRIKARSLEP